MNSLCHFRLSEIILYSSDVMRASLGNWLRLAVSLKEMRSGFGSVRFTVELHDLRGLLQPK